MLGYHSILSPIGPLCLAATERGLCRVSWHSSEREFVAELEAEYNQNEQRAHSSAPEQPGGAGAVFSRMGTSSVSAPVTSLLQEAACQLGQYFEGQRRAFPLPLDLSRLRAFQRHVLVALLEVPYGEVVTYGGLAVLSGYPGAARAVGGAMRRNPLPIIIPCHRVLPSSGGLGGFGDRPDLKRRLLELEGWSDVSGSPPLPFK